MTAFTDAEVEYLRSQPLMRFATASTSGKPDVAPVVFECDGDDIVRCHVGCLVYEEDPVNLPRVVHQLL